MEKENNFYVIMKDNIDPYLDYYLTHNIFYTEYDISMSFQDNCIFASNYLEEIKKYLEKDSKKYNYTYEIEVFE